MVSSPLMVTRLLVLGPREALVCSVQAVQAVRSRYLARAALGASLGPVLPSSSQSARDQRGGDSAIIMSGGWHGWHVRHVGHQHGLNQWSSDVSVGILVEFESIQFKVPMSRQFHLWQGLKCSVSAGRCWLCDNMNTRDTWHVGDAMSVSCCLQSDHNDSKEEDEILKSEQNPAETNNNINSDNNNVVVVTKLKTNGHVKGGYLISLLIQNQINLLIHSLPTIYKDNITFNGTFDSIPILFQEWARTMQVAAAGRASQSITLTLDILTPRMTMVSAPCPLTGRRPTPTRGSRTSSTTTQVRLSSGWFIKASWFPSSARQKAE